MVFPLTVDELERLFARQDRAETRGDIEAADEWRREWERRQDESTTYRHSGLGEIAKALALAGFLASSDVRRRISRAARLIQAGDFGVKLLAALRQTIKACLDDIDASHVRPILANVLAAASRLRAV